MDDVPPKKRGRGRPRKTPAPAPAPERAPIEPEEVIIMSAEQASPAVDEAVEEIQLAGYGRIRTRTGAGARTRTGADANATRTRRRVHVADAGCVARREGKGAARCRHFENSSISRIVQVDLYASFRHHSVRI